MAPAKAWAQEAGRTYRLAYLSQLPPGNPSFIAIREELARAGFVDGKNLTIDARFNLTPDRLPAVTAELVKSAPDVISAGSEAAARAALATTKTIAIVAFSDDLVRAGFVASLAHPGSNLTGVSILGTELNEKRQQLLIEMVPGIKRVATLADPRTTGPERLDQLRKDAVALGIEPVIYQMTNADEIASAIDEARAAGAQAINVLASILFHLNRHDIFARVAAAKLPAMFQWPEYVEEGALFGYGPRNITVIRKHFAALLIKILRGAKPADLPAEQPTEFELGINLQTAEKLGLTIPENFVARADHAIR